MGLLKQPVAEASINDDPLTLPVQVNGAKSDRLLVEQNIRVGKTKSQKKNSNFPDEDAFLPAVHAIELGLGGFGHRYPLQERKIRTLCNHMPRNADRLDSLVPATYVKLT